MSSQNTNRPRADRPPKLTEKERPARSASRSSTNSGRPEPQTDPDNPPSSADRDRLRDIIVVFIAYPLTPTDRASKVGQKRPWLEVVSLVLKAVLAAYAIYRGTEPGEW